MTRGEMTAALETLERWPHSERLALLELEPAEREAVLLLAGELDATPVDDDGYALDLPSRRSTHVGFDERRNTSRAFAPDPGTAERARAALEEWRRR